MQQHGIAKLLGCAGAGKLDALHSGSRQGLKLSRLAHPILVQVTPDAQVGKLGVTGIEHRIAIAVEVCQGSKAIAGSGACIGASGENRFIAEQFTARINNTIAIQIPHQNAIIRPHPGGAGLQRIGIGVKQHPSRQRRDLQAIAIQVQHQGVYVSDGFNEGVGEGA